MRLNPIIVLLVDLVAGWFVIGFARKAYSNPDSTLQRWYSYLPLKDWSRRLLREFAMFWIFAAILLILTGLAGVLPFLNNHRGGSLVLLFVGLAVVSTVFVVPRAKKTT